MSKHFSKVKWLSLKSWTSTTDFVHDFTTLRTATAPECLEPCKYSGRGTEVDLVQQWPVWRAVSPVVVNYMAHCNMLSSIILNKKRWQIWKLSWEWIADPFGMYQWGNFKWLFTVIKHRFTVYCCCQTFRMQNMRRSHTSISISNIKVYWEIGDWSIIDRSNMNIETTVIEGSNLFDRNET